MNPFVTDIGPLQPCNFPRSQSEETCEGEHELSLNIGDQSRDDVFALFQRVCVRRFSRPCRSQAASITDGIRFDEASAKRVPEQSAQQRTNVGDCTSNVAAPRRPAYSPFHLMFFDFNTGAMAR